MLVESRTYTCDGCGKKVVTYPGISAADTESHDRLGWYVLHAMAGWGYESRTVRMDFCSRDCLSQHVQSSPKGERDE